MPMIKNAGDKTLRKDIEGNWNETSEIEGIESHSNFVALSFQSRFNFRENLASRPTSRTDGDFFPECRHPNTECYIVRTSELICPHYVTKKRLRTGTASWTRGLWFWRFTCEAYWTEQISEKCLIFAPRIWTQINRYGIYTWNRKSNSPRFVVFRYETW